MRPLTCIACGDVAGRDDLLCSTVHEVPLGILRHLNFRSDVPNPGPAAPSSAALQKAVARDGGAVAHPAAPPVSTRPVSSLAYAPPQQPSCWESKARGAASSAWATLKFLFLMLLLAIAAQHH